MECHLFPDVYRLDLCDARTPYTKDYLPTVLIPNWLQALTTLYSVS